MNQKTILVYGDALSRGIIPGTCQCRAFDERWPGILQRMLGSGTLLRTVECHFPPDLDEPAHDRLAAVLAPLVNDIVNLEHGPDER